MQIKIIDLHRQAKKEIFETKLIEQRFKSFHFSDVCYANSGGELAARLKICEAELAHYCSGQRINFVELGGVKLKISLSELICFRPLSVVN